jgi:antitoxin (DNA-binding transcriptional repressor) of toxin-antitoxin stability system
MSIPMTTTITVDEAQAKLKELIRRMAPGEEVILTENQQVVAKLVSQPAKHQPALRPPPGLGKGFITIIADDDEHLKDFAEYMPCGCCSTPMPCTGMSKAIRSLVSRLRR